MDPQISAFLLGAITVLTKVGFIGFLAAGVGWWDARRKLKRLQATQANPSRLEERLANLESASDYTASQVDRILEGQAALARQLAELPLREALPRAPDADNRIPRPPRSADSR